MIPIVKNALLYLNIIIFDKFLFKLSKKVVLLKIDIYLILLKFKGELFMKKALRILSLVTAFILMVNTAQLNVKAAGSEPKITWLSKEYTLPFTSTNNFSQGLAVVEFREKYGFIDITGREVISLKYSYAESFSEDLAAVELNGKWGFIDKTGKEVIPLKYDYAIPFSEGLAAVRLDGDWGFIDKNGNEVIPISYKYAELYSFSEGLAVAKMNNDWYIDENGKEVLPANGLGYGYDIARPFKEGLAAVGKVKATDTSSEVMDIPGAKYGFIDKKGNEIVPFKYNEVYDFNEGLAAVELNGKWGFIDKTGKEVISPKYNYADFFREGLAAVEYNGQYEFIDKNGNRAIQKRYDYADPFSEGLAFVILSDHAAYIDKTGKEVITLRDNGLGFYTGYEFKGNAAFVSQGAKLGIIKNPLGNAINQINAVQIERLCGDTRYKTSATISRSGWERSDNVILVNGNNFPDALVGASFAYLKDAPILITMSNSLDGDTSKEIVRLGAKTVYILGSYASVSKAVEDKLKQNYNVIRIGGTEVFDTAVMVGDEIRKEKKFDTVIIATQENFPDALAIAPFSARDTMPILFSKKDKLRVDTKKALQDWDIKKVIISGGTGVVSSAVENELKGMGITVQRLAGADRYTTAAEIAKHFEPQEGYTNISIATGKNYPDALTGAVLAAKNNTPLILVNKDIVDSCISDYTNKHVLNKAYIFGGTGVVSDKVVKILKK